ncbi:acyl-CoA thioesterase [Gilvimarinus sp. F26214L]|uniref:acyl-CoA thioesterase n=1 Tax=Gilvimarinus sp. DZF01 TaxID=3461371 RepID=UPI00404629ED
MQPFRILLRVRYYECDAQGVVFNARYGDYADTAVTEFMAHTVDGYQAMRARNLDNQVVHMATSWRSSARFDDVLAISVETRRVGTTSFTVSVAMEQYPGGTPVATCEITYVMVTAQGLEKTPVPDDIRERLLAGAPGGLVNFSGLELPQLR